MLASLNIWGIFFCTSPFIMFIVLMILKEKGIL